MVPASCIPYIHSIQSIHSFKLHSPAYLNAYIIPYHHSDRDIYHTHTKHSNKPICRWRKGGFLNDPLNVRWTAFHMSALPPRPPTPPRATEHTHITPPLHTFVLLLTPVLTLTQRTMQVPHAYY